MPDIAMRAPAVAIFGSGEFRTAAQLRPAGKAARVIRAFAVARRGRDIAAPDRVAEETGRGGHHGRVVGLGRHPVDAGEVKAADAAGLMAARAGHTVETALKARVRACILQRAPLLR